MDNKISENKISWKAPEYHFEPKKADWYWAVSLIAVSVAVSMALLENILLSILVIVAAIALILYASRPPRVFSYEIAEQGVKIGGQLHTFGSLQSFFVEEGEYPPKLLIKRRSIVSTMLIIPIGDNVNPSRIREIISKKLPEEEMSEPLSQKVMEYLGF